MKLGFLVLSVGLRLGDGLRDGLADRLRLALRVCHSLRRPRPRRLRRLCARAASAG